LYTTSQQIFKNEHFPQSIQYLRIALYLQHHRKKPKFFQVEKIAWGGFPEGIEEKKWGSQVPLDEVKLSVV